MAEKKSWSPIRFDYRAAIDEYLAKPQPDFEVIARDAAQRMRDYAASEEFKQDALDSVGDSIRRMREQTGDLDAGQQAKARRAVEANEEWIQAEENKREALATGDLETVAAEVQAQQVIDRELDMFELMQSIQGSTAASAVTLGEIQAARRLADKEQTKQAGVNKAMAAVALILAAGSFLMPFVEQFVWKDPPPKQDVIIVQSQP